MQVSELAFARLLNFLDISFNLSSILDLDLLVLDDTFLESFRALNQLRQLIFQELLVLASFELYIDHLFGYFIDLTFDSFDLLVSTALIDRNLHLGLFDEGLIHVAMV